MRKTKMEKYFSEARTLENALQKKDRKGHGENLDAENRGTA